MNDLNLKSRPWWTYLTESQQDLLSQAEVLLEREEVMGAQAFDDYSFIVFPAAKAYEGFLKKLFYDLKLITLEEYQGKSFRVGRSLNPSLPEKLRNHDWVYDDLCNLCNGHELPQALWETWREVRSMLFHWWPEHKNFITLSQARKRLNMIAQAVDQAFTECRIKSPKPRPPAQDAGAAGG